MFRFALARQGRDCQVCTRGRARFWRGSLPVLELKKHNRFGHRRPELNLQPCTEARKVFLAARNDRICTQGAN
jgi:hypothetical protein